MAKKEESKSKKNLALEESAGKEEGKKISKRKETNIRDYTIPQLMKMWNSTDDNNFSDMYPEATFTRRQAYDQLKDNSLVKYMNGFMVPKDFDRSTVVELINSFNGDAEKATDKHQIMYNGEGETERATITVKSEVLNRWKKMLKDRCAKRDDIQGYYTLALEKLMDELDNGLKIVREM